MDDAKKTTAEADYCEFVARAKAALPERVTDAGALAGHYVSRESTDFLGRFDDAFGEVQNVFDDYPDGDVPLESAHLAFEAFETIAVLAMAQLAMLRALHPTAGISPDDHNIAPTHTASTRPTRVRIVSEEEGMPRGEIFEVVGWTGFDQAVVRDERDECLLVLMPSDFEAVE